MSKLNLHDECRHMHSIGPQLCTATAMLGKVIDTRGYNGVEVLFHYGSFSAATEVLTVTLLESDSATTGTFTSVADTNLVGTEALASIPAASRTSGTTKYVGKRLGYVGNKRYVRPVITAVGTTTAIVGCTVLLYNPEAAATSNP